MKVVVDDLWLCTDCTIYAANGDTSGIDDPKREREVVRGVNALGKHLVPDFDSETNEGIEEFSHSQCAGCGTRLGGERTRFAILGTRARPSRSVSTRSAEQEEMTQLLKKKGYDQPATVAAKLSKEGMGFYELEHILKTTTPGGVGSLEYTHRYGLKRS